MGKGTGTSADQGGKVDFECPRLGRTRIEFTRECDEIKGTKQQHERPSFSMEQGLSTSSYESSEVEKRALRRARRGMARKWNRDETRRYTSMKGVRSGWRNVSGTGEQNCVVTDGSVHQPNEKSSKMRDCGMRGVKGLRGARMRGM